MIRMVITFLRPGNARRSNLRIAEPCAVGAIASREVDLYSVEIRKESDGVGKIETFYDCAKIPVLTLRPSECFGLGLRLGLGLGAGLGP